MTRVKANAFNNLHQVERKLKLRGGSPSDLMTVSTLSEFGLTAAESEATKNMLCWTPATCKKMLAKAASTHGMWRGPFSHAYLGAPSIRIGFSPTMEDEWWQDRMTSEVSTVELLHTRVISDWVSTPAGLRKTSGLSHANDYQKICRVYELHMDKLKEIIPPDGFAEESRSFKSSFLLGCYDEIFKLTADNQPRPLDIKKIPEFAAAIQRQEAKLEKHELDRRSDLKTQIEHATYNSLCNDLNDDFATLTKYNDDLMAAHAEWGPAVASYKRARRNKGVQKVQAMMQSRLQIGTLGNEGLHDIAKCYSLFKKVSQDVINHIAVDKVCMP
jgi:hypothetical protein